MHLYIPLFQNTSYDSIWASFLFSFKGKTAIKTLTFFQKCLTRTSNGEYIHKIFARQKPLNAQKTRPTVPLRLYIPFLICKQYQLKNKYILCTICYTEINSTFDEKYYERRPMVATFSIGSFSCPCNPGYTAFVPGVGDTKT